jgi:hypothetical protein
MIPQQLDAALHAGREVHTDTASGLTIIRRLADLILPTGRILIGFPGSSPINEPSPIRPQVAPGQYPVFAALLQLPEDRLSLAFVSIRFHEEEPVQWEEAGAFFTDSGDGCLMDESCVGLLDRLDKDAEFWQFRRQVKIGVFTGGDCCLPLDPKSGANAIVFRTFDAQFPCFLGKDRDGTPVCLVVDCR